ncbi:MAG: collagen-like protein, partial [Porphyromonas sp.]
QGEKGEKGDKGDNGNDGSDGNDGNDGANGKSAYELWKEEVINNCGKATQVMDPHNPSQPWDCNKTSFNDFMDYLRGKDAEEKVIPGTIVKGKFNVLAQYYNAALKEYVDPKDGSVIFVVLDKEGAKAPAGSKVKGLPGISNQTFTVGDDGEIRVTRDQLPDKLPEAQRIGSAAEVTIGGITETSAKNTIVPNRVNTRLSANLIYLRQPTAQNLGGGSYPMGHFTVIAYKYEREVDGTWVAYPDVYPKPVLSTAFVKNKDVTVDESNITDNAESNKWGITQSYADYNMAKNVCLIIRPVVLHDTEKRGSLPNPPIGDYGKRFNHNKEFEWKQEDMYFTVRGKEYFYGQQPILPNAVHVPEIYPMVPFKDNTKIEIIQGVTKVWGELDMESLPETYINYEAPTGHIWKAKKETAAEMKARFQNKIISQIFVHGTKDNQVTNLYNKIPWSKGHAKFSIHSIYPGFVLTTMMYIDDDIKGKTTQAAESAYILGSAFAPYRAVPYYILKENAGNYFLKYIFNANPDKPLPKENLPADWTN